MIKEAFDDCARMKRDKVLNTRKYSCFNKGVWKDTKSQNIKCGQLIKINQNERVPADVVVLYTTEKAGSVFIRTDQLDGETDWKLRRAVHHTQTSDPEEIPHLNSSITCEPPNKSLYEFQGVYQNESVKEPLYLENTMWMDTVLASSGYIIGIVVYTGVETIAQMNSSLPRQKVGLLDQEINYLSKILFVLMLFFSGTIVVLNGFHGNWALMFFRYVLLLCSIISISLRVNLDMAKIWYSYCIDHDKAIHETITRNSTIPEELG